MPFLGNASLYDLLSSPKSMNKMWITLRSMHLPYHLFVERDAKGRSIFDFRFCDFVISLDSITKTNFKMPKSGNQK